VRILPVLLHLLLERLHVEYGRYAVEQVEIPVDVLLTVLALSTSRMMASRV
jgi:hypothetical protein